MLYITYISKMNSDNILVKQTLGYECKNLIPYPYLMTTTTNNGITWTDNGDGTVAANGTTNNSGTDSYFNCRGRANDDLPVILPAGTYILSGCPSGGSVSRGYFMQVGMTKDNAYYRLGYDVGEGCKFTLTEDTQLQVQCCVDNHPDGVTVSNVVFKPMIRRAEITDDTYEPYNLNVDERISKANDDIEKIRSHIGMVIHSTTLDTMEKVIAIYGGTTWEKIEGQFLLGQSSSYAINSTGGSATNTLTTENLPSHIHTVGAHTHGLNNHTHSIPALSGSTTSTGAHSHSIGKGISGADGTWVPVYGEGLESGTLASSGGHSHNIKTNASTSGAASGSTANSTAFNTGTTGSGTAVNNMPPYKTVYIWERTA